MRFKLSLYIYRERRIVMSYDNQRIVHAIDAIENYLNNKLPETKLWEHSFIKKQIDRREHQDAARQFQPYGYDRRADERSRLWASSHIRRRKISHYGERHKGFCHCRRAAGENKPVETY